MPEGFGGRVNLVGRVEGQAGLPEHAADQTLVGAQRTDLPVHNDGGALGAGLVAPEGRGQKEGQAGQGKKRAPGPEAYPPPSSLDPVEQNLPTSSGRSHGEIPFGVAESADVTWKGQNSALPLRWSLK